MLCADLRETEIAIPAADLRCASRVKDGFEPVSQCFIETFVNRVNISRSEWYGLVELKFRTISTRYGCSRSRGRNTGCDWTP